MEVVNALLNADGIDPNKAWTSTGCTPLWVASEYGHVDVVDRLLERAPAQRHHRRVCDAATSLYQCGYIASHL